MTGIAIEGDIRSAANDKLLAKNLCVCCSRMYDTVRDTMLEQRIVGDEDFCGACWNEIMTAEYAGDFSPPQLK